MSTHWNPQLYDDKHAFVYNYGESLVKLLAPQPDERILDLGCGTGALTKKINEAGATVVGIDQADAMIREAQANYPDLEFRVMDAAGLRFSTPFDAVFSNAALHWVLEKEKAVRSIAASLRPGGRMVAEFGGKGNIGTILRKIREILTAHDYPGHAARQIWYFPSVSEYTALLEQHGFEVTYARLYDRPTPLTDPECGIIDWINMFGGAFFEGIEERERQSLISEIQDQLRDECFRENTWWADYRRLQVIARKVE
jgi:trans-aconitate methyltransferase